MKAFDLAAAFCWGAFAAIAVGKLVWGWNTWIEDDNTVGIVLGWLVSIPVGTIAGSRLGMWIVETWLRRRAA